MKAVLNTKLWMLLTLSIFFTNRIELMVVLLLTLLVMTSKKTVTFPFKITISMLAVYAVSLFASYSVGYNIGKSFQQMILITLFIFCYYQIFNPQVNQQRHLYSLFHAYLSVSTFMAIVAVVQVSIYYLFQVDIVDYIGINSFFQQVQGTQKLTENIIRARAFALEPGTLATLLLPAIIYTFFFNDPMQVLSLRKRIILLLAGLFTFSPFVYIAYVIIVINYLTHRFQHLRFPILIVGIVSVIYVLFANNENDNYAANGIGNIQMRLVDTYKVIETFSDPTTIVEKNTSTAVLQAQLYSAWNAPSRWLGTGLGTNSQSFQNAFRSIFKGNYIFLELNSDDAYSIGIRIFSELGIIGLLLYLWFIIRHFNRHNYLNLCIFSVILSYMFRGGSYISFGIIFFHFFYYYTSKFNLTLSR